MWLHIAFQSRNIIPYMPPVELSFEEEGVEDGVGAGAGAGGIGIGVTTALGAAGFFAAGFFLATAFLAAFFTAFFAFLAAFFTTFFLAAFFTDFLAFAFPFLAAFFAFFAMVQGGLNFFWSYRLIDFLKSSEI